MESLDVLERLDELERITYGAVHVLSEDQLAGFEHWWAANHFALLDLRELQRQRERTTGSAGFFLGDGDRRGRDAATEERGAVARARVVPLLLDALAQSPGPRLRAALYVALGRAHASASAEQQREIEAVLVEGWASPDRASTLAALLGAGLTGSHRVVSTLAAVALDETAGRRATGGGEVGTDLRASAAHALGLLGAATAREDVRRYCVHVLVRVAHETGEKRPDVAASAFLAMAMVPLEQVGVRDAAGALEPASSSRLALLRHLIAQFERDLEPRARMALPSALALLVDGLPEGARDAGREGAAWALLASLSDRRSQRAEYASGVALALGFLGRPTGAAVDVAIADALEDLARDARAGTRERARLALGRVAGSPGERARSEALARTLLADAQRESGGDRVFALLGLGFAARGLHQRGAALPTAWEGALLAQLADARDSQAAVAAGWAAALARIDSAGPRLVAEFERLPAGPLRGMAGLSLGLLGVRDAGPTLLAHLETGGADARVVWGGGIGLELLGAGGAAATWIEALGENVSGVRAASAAAALGESSSAKAHDLLTRWLADHTEAEATRAAAALALGRWVDVRDVPLEDLVEPFVCHEALPLSQLALTDPSSLARMY